MEIYTVEEFKYNPQNFDAIISISSREHDGLKRYGDPINPNGDYEAMENIKTLLKPNGLFFFAVPVTQDSITWNAHRTYGLIRLPKILNGWGVLDSYGFNPKIDFKKDPYLCQPHQPVFVLRAEESE